MRHVGSGQMSCRIHENLIVEMTVLVASIRQHQAALAAPGAVKDAAHDAFEDLITHCTRIMSSMLSTPLAGRLLIPTPEETMSMEARAQSLQSTFINTV